MLLERKQDGTITLLGVIDLFSFFVGVNVTLFIVRAVLLLGLGI